MTVFSIVNAGGISFPLQVRTIPPGLPSWPLHHVEASFDGGKSSTRSGYSNPSLIGTPQLCVAATILCFHYSGRETEYSMVAGFPPWSPTRRHHIFLAVRRQTDLRVRSGVNNEGNTRESAQAANKARVLARRRVSLKAFARWEHFPLKFGNTLESIVPYCFL